MSWKGFQKAIVRLPHIVKQKTGIVAETKDGNYEDLEGHFNELENCIEKLSKESKKYTSALSDILNSQEELIGDFIELLCDSDPSSEHQLPYSLSTLEDYIEKLGLAKIELLGQLVVTVENQLTKPMTELQTLLKNVRFKISKRDHKLIDYDRHRIELEKLKMKSKEKNVSSNIDKKIIKQEHNFERANEDYRKLNEQLKREIPILIECVSRMTFPAFQAIFQLQRSFAEKNIEMLKLLCPNVESKASIMRNFERKKELYTKILLECELLSDTCLVSSSSLFSNATSSSPDANTDSSAVKGLDSSLISNDLSDKFSSTSIQSQPSSIKMMQKEQFVVALYDYKATEEGDLTFCQNETIKVLEKDDSGWWKGTLKGNTGLFPSNYVRSLQV